MEPFIVVLANPVLAVPPNPAQGTQTFSFNANERWVQDTFCKQQNGRGKNFL